MKIYFRHNLRLMQIFIFSLITVYCLLSTASYAETPGRIISLAPSVTEILFAAGMGDRVTGVTTFCDYPQEAKKRQKIGGMSNPSLEAVISLRPDIVIMTTDGNPKEFEYKLRSMKIKTHIFEALTLNELPDGIRKIGMALDQKDKFDVLASNIEETINSYKVTRQEAKHPLIPLAKGGRGGITNYEIRTPKSEMKKVLFIIWPEPLVVAGPRTAVDDAINLLGGINIAGDAKSRYPKYSIEEIIRRSPDVIIIGKMREDIQKISGRLLERISTVPAVKNKKIFYTGDSLYRLGPRVIEGIEEISHYMND
ncbi:MAG: cobalamin-binding protein [Nitrospirae bacterium]|nr:cobalamin-binding protein [Nitrospirota bacterium]